MVSHPVPTLHLESIFLTLSFQRPNSSSVDVFQNPLHVTNSFSKIHFMLPSHFPHHTMCFCCLLGHHKHNTYSYNNSCIIAIQTWLRKCSVRDSVLSKAHLEGAHYWLFLAITIWVISLPFFFCGFDCHFSHRICENPHPSCKWAKHQANALNPSLWGFIVPPLPLLLHVCRLRHPPSRLHLYFTQGLQRLNSRASQSP